MLSPAQASAFHGALLSDFQSIAASLCRIDARSATAFKGTDLDMIEAAIQENLSGGFVELNTVVAGLLRGWLAASGKRQLSALPEVDRALHPLHNQVANLLSELGDGASARALYEEAMAARRDALGPKHADTLLSANNLASVLLNTGACPSREAHARTRARLLMRVDSAAQCLSS